MGTMDMLRKGALLAAACLFSACGPNEPERSATDGHAHEHTGEAQQPLLANPGFETGTAGQPPPSWNVATNLNNGITLQTPQTKAGLNLAAGGIPRTVILNAPGGAGTQIDPNLGAAASFRWPRTGNQVALVNQLGDNNNVNTMSQSMVIGPSDVDPTDNNVHIRFVLAPVLENPNHQQTQQPYFFVQVTNVTQGNAILYRDFNFSNQPGVPWKTSNGFLYTDWALIDVMPGSANVAQGDTVLVEIIGAGCSLGGHFGQVYVDDVPSLFVSATAPAAANAGTNITYTVTYRNNGGSAASGVGVDFVTPPTTNALQTTFTSINAPGLMCTTPAVGASGTVTCTVGNLAAGASGSFQVTVNIPAAGTGQVIQGNYDIFGTGFSPLLGSKVYTNITNGVTYADLGITMTNGQTNVVNGQVLTYTITVSNAGPNAIVGGSVTDLFPATLSNVSWTCAASAGSSCTASGMGNINASPVSLLVGGTATYTVTATVAGSPPSVINNIASVAVPAGASDPAPANNSVGLQNPIVCAGFGQPCTVGVGECQVAGTNICQGNVAVCNAVAGMPSPEICDGKDNNCNGQIDDGNPGGGAACATGLPGVCASGLTACTAGAISCTTTTMPGSQMEVCGNALDEDCDGALDNGCPDTDGDGLVDALEILIGSNPNDADTDDDGLLDGEELDPSGDADGDGLINILDPDSDNDGLPDGLELGKDCNNPATDKSKKRCIPDADPATTTNPLNADTDSGGVKDGSEDANLNGKVDPGETNPALGNGGDDNSAANTDSDGDGLSDALELFLGSNPNDADTDDDGVLDGQEPNPSIDMDGDGLIDVLDCDSDNDGLFDGTEMGLGCNHPATDNSKGHCRADADDGLTVTCAIDPDTDHGGVKDGAEDANLDGKVDANETDPTLGQGDDDGSPLNLDSDGDGLTDALELFLGSNPNDADTDDDGALDGEEPNPSADMDGDGLIDVLDPDSDNDGLADGTEMGKNCNNPATDNSKHLCRADADPTTTTCAIDPDTDHGGAKDGSEDVNLNGKLDPGEKDPTVGHGADDPSVTDSDGDGLSDGLELFIGSDPNDADTDDDGALDGQEPNPAFDMDGDGLIDVLDPDSDNDGLYDGTEMGKDCSNSATDVTKNHCIADADPSTTTSPLDPDTDNGGIKDGVEDVNHDGKLDLGETDPTLGHGADDHNNPDNDNDGLTDAEETFIGTDPDDADSDDDGVLDGDEPNFADDTDGDGKINALDPDSDNDGLFDGTELGLDCGNPATEASAMACIPDGDSGATKTSPLDPDTDHGSVKDGDEDANHNGVLDPGETDPTLGHGVDDTQTDSDNDGIPDLEEIAIGTDPNDADSDDDGVLDGQEPSYDQDSDNDGKINALDPDSDNDGILDGTELGLDCGNPATDTSKGNCVPDGDMGATKTNPLDPDTDHGGVPDGQEDANHNGKIDVDELDPNDPSDDMGCKLDSECGDDQSGKVCSLAHVCIDGCRGTDGNGCPEGQECSSTTNLIGVCKPIDEEKPGVYAEGNGIFCATRQGTSENDNALWLLGGVALLAVTRRRRRAA